MIVKRNAEIGRGNCVSNLGNVITQIVLLALILVFASNSLVQARAIKLTRNFQPGSAAAFERALTADIDTVILDVSGGYLNEGIEIGRLIRAHNLRTVVPKNASCLSACAEAFLGGVGQKIDGVVAFHVPSSRTLSSRTEAFSSGLVGGTLTAIYRHDMGYGFGLTEAIMKWTNESRLLSFDNIRELNSYRGGSDEATFPKLIKYRP